MLAPEDMLVLVNGTMLPISILNAHYGAPQMSALSWLRRPFAAIAAIIVMAAAIGLGHICLRQSRDSAVSLLPYNSSILARCRERGQPVIVIYQYYSWPSMRCWAYSPFHYYRQECAALFSRMDMIAMDADMANDEIMAKEAAAIEMDIAAVAADKSNPTEDLPLIVIYGPRARTKVIRAHAEGNVERATQVFRDIKEFELRESRD